MITPVQGHAGFGNQCPALGNFVDPTPFDLNLYNCPITHNSQSLQLVKEPDSLILSADCVKKLVTARTPDRRLDSLWEVLPDGTFAFTVDGGYVSVDDGSGTPCSTSVSLTISGSIDCHDHDHPSIRFEALYFMGKAPDHPRPETPVVPQPLCQIPNAGDGCFMRAVGTINQCS